MKDSSLLAIAWAGICSVMIGMALMGGPTAIDGLVVGLGGVAMMAIGFFGLGRRH